MKRLLSLLALCHITGNASADLVTYEIVGTLTQYVGSGDALGMEGATYHLLATVETDAPPYNIWNKSDPECMACVVFANWQSPGTATLTITNRPNGRPDLRLEPQFNATSTANSFTWDGTPARADSFLISLLPDAPVEGFFDFDPYPIPFWLRHDFFSNELNPPPTYFPDFGPMPRYFLPGAILGLGNSDVLAGRVTPWDPLDSYALKDFSVGTSADGRFDDVLPNHWAFDYIENLAASGITSGCGNDNYCPQSPVTRAQMAVFLERGMRGSTFVPPPAKGNVFMDVAAGAFAANFIEQLYLDGITVGCGGNEYCPDGQITRAEMAVFLLRGKHGAAYWPPAATGMFSDVPLSHWAVHWIEQLAREGITGGCGGGKYCPSAVVTRDQMAVFLVRTLGL